MLMLVVRFLGGSCESRSDFLGHVDVVRDDLLGLRAGDEGLLELLAVLGGGGLLEEVLVLVDNLLGHTDAVLALRGEAGLVEPGAADRTDLVHDLHRLDGLDPQITVVSNRNVSALLEVEGGIDGHFLSSQPSVGLGPLHLTRVVLRLEMLVALGPTESEDLAIITDESNSSAWAR